MATEGADPLPAVALLRSSAPGGDRPRNRSPERALVYRDRLAQRSFCSGVRCLRRWAGYGCFTAHRRLPVCDLAAEPRVPGEGRRGPQLITCVPGARCDVVLLLVGNARKFGMPVLRMARPSPGHRRRPCCRGISPWAILTFFYSRGAAYARPSRAQRSHHYGHPFRVPKCAMPSIPNMPMRCIKPF